MNVALKAFFASCALAGACLVACSSSHHAGSAPPGANPEQVGTIGLQFTTPAGITIDSVSYTISGPTRASGTIDVSQARSSIEFVVGGLAAGAGYSITLSATDTAGDTCASSPATFDITGGATTPVSVDLVCVLGGGGIVYAEAGTGSVEIDAGVVIVDNPPIVCPAVSSFSVSPTEESVGATSAIAVSTTPSGATVAYAVTPTAGSSGNGTVSSITAAGATFTCTSAGQVTLSVGATVTLPDGGVFACPKMQALIDCEPPVCMPPLALCAGACTDLQIDPNNCGACGVACDSPVAWDCVAGQCTCPPEAQGCGCANLSNDPKNCGACGNACGSGEHCCDGMCESSLINCPPICGPHCI